MGLPRGLAHSWMARTKSAWQRRGDRDRPPVDSARGGEDHARSLEGEGQVLPGSLPIGAEAGRYLRSLRWAEASKYTIDTYEIVLRRLALDHLDLELRDFEPPLGNGTLPRVSGSPLGRCLTGHPAQPPPCAQELLPLDGGRGANVGQPDAACQGSEEEAGRPKGAPPGSLIQQIIAAQPTLRDQVAIQLLARLGLRRHERRLLRIRNIDLTAGLITGQGKGGKRAIMPLGFKDLQRGSLPAYQR